MRVSLQWLREFVPVTEGAEAVADRLTMAGLEVEALEPAGGDVMLEVNVTPNRADCLSIVGIARELSALYGVPLTLPELDFLAETGPLDFNIDIIDPHLCHRYAGRIVKDLTIGPSPQWLRERVEKAGIRSINNVVDVTNYVLIELGHPLHAFDLTTIKGNLIRVGTPRSILGVDGLSMTTLDGVERNIPAGGLLIWDAERPVAIAGVMGGLDTEVRDTTTHVFIESAYFEPLSIRRTSKTLGLKTESSYRFERGTDIKMLKKALDRAALLMKKVAGGHILGKIDIYPTRHVPAEIVVRYDRINSLLGLSLTREEVLSCLRALCFEVATSASSLLVKPPAYRNDVREEWDVIEEIARIHGYDKVPADLPKITIGAGEGRTESRAHTLRTVQSLRHAFLKTGFTEVINFSFMGAQDLDLLALDENDVRRQCIEIMNPLRTEEALMRTTLAPSLIRNARQNIAQGNRDLRLFEIARVYLRQPGASLPHEKEHLGALWYREKTKSLYQDPAPDFYAFKGIVEAVLADMNAPGPVFRRSSEPFLNAGQAADIYIAERKAGFLGALSPAVLESLGSKAQAPSGLVLELDLEALVPHAMRPATYTPLARYPYVERDTAVVVDAAMETILLRDLAESYETELIEEVSLFDVYQGGSIPAGKKSVAFRVRYRGRERTLTDEEVDRLHGSLVRFILERTQGQLRQ
jgi:phenylalanyl-tRNA synthetase beta chain